jgi:gluconate 2-dehydrogenase
MKPHVFIAAKVPAEVEAYIAEHCSYRKWEGDEPISRVRLRKEIADAEGLLVVGGQIDSELLDRAPRLKVVSNISVGYNNMDWKVMKALGVMGTNTPYVLDETVADLAFALILSTARRVPELDRHVKKGKWAFAGEGERGRDLPEGNPVGCAEAQCAPALRRLACARRRPAV